jgi:hypothetical protein
MPLVDQELHTLSDHMRSCPVNSGVSVAQSLVVCVVHCRSFLFLLTIVCMSFFYLRLLITSLAIVCMSFYLRLLITSLAIVCMSFFYLRLLITSLAIVCNVLFLFTASDYLFGIVKLFLKFVFAILPQ